MSYAGPIPWQPRAPRLDAVYPEGPVTVRRADYLGPLYLVRAPKAVQISDNREADYALARDFGVRVWIEGEPDPRLIVAPAGLLTDLASVPAVFRPIVGRVGPHLEAAIVHDFLFVAWQDMRAEPRRSDFDFANDVFAALLAAAGVRSPVRQAMAAAVRLAGWRMFREIDPIRYVWVP